MNKYFQEFIIEKQEEVYENHPWDQYLSRDTGRNIKMKKSLELNDFFHSQYFFNLFRRIFMEKNK